MCFYIITVNLFSTVNGGIIIGVRLSKCHIKISSKETSEVKLMFYCLVELVIKTLTSNNIDPADILDVLPSTISAKLQATSIDGIFKENAALDEELKWYSFPLLKLLIDKFCDNECKSKLEDYVKTLENYLRSRLLPFHDGGLTPKQLPAHPSPYMQIMVDTEWSQKLVGSGSDLSERDFIASLLNTTTDRIQFINCGL